MLKLVATFSFLLVARMNFSLGQGLCNRVSNHRNARLLPQSPHCGRAPSHCESLIMGGVNANLAEFPWIAALYINRAYAKWKFCDGTLINNKYVLTAAHCALIPNQHDKILTVVLGEYDVRGRTNDCIRTHTGQVCAPSALEYQVEEVKYHSGFRPSQQILSNDIAIIRLRGTVQFNDFIQPICLPISCDVLSNDFAGQNVVAAGWGVLQDSPNQVDAYVLQKTNLVALTVDQCGKDWYYSGLQIVPSQLCAVKRGSGTCHGDSGGPVIANVGSTQYLVGVVSAGPDCNSIRPSWQPNIFTRVTSFMPWILDQIRD